MSCAHQTHGQKAATIVKVIQNIRHTLYYVKQTLHSKVTTTKRQKNRAKARAESTEASYKRITQLLELNNVETELGRLQRKYSKIANSDYNGPRRGIEACIQQNMLPLPSQVTDIVPKNLERYQRLYNVAKALCRLYMSHIRYLVM